MDCLIVATDVEGGYYMDYRGIPHGVRAVNVPEVDWNEEGERDGEKKNLIWACMEEDVPLFVEKVTLWHPGVMVRVYKIAGMYTRQPGEMTQLNVGKEGILPF